MNNNEIFNKIDFNILNYKDLVFDRFKKLCGFFESDAIDKNRISEAINYFEKSFLNFDVKIKSSFFEENFFEKFNININDEILKIFLDSIIKGFLVFGIGAFEKNNYKKENLLEEFYFDLTGTAIVDVSREILKTYFQNEFVQFVSEAFGVGFFGIKQEEIYKFFEIMDFSKIGFYLNENFVIYPDKSFIGFFVVSENQIYIKNDCKNCIGKSKGCFFCKNKS